MWAVRCLPTYPLELARPFGNLSVFDIASESQIDMIQHSCIAGSRLAGCAWHQACGERRDRLGVRVI